MWNWFDLVVILISWIPNPHLAVMRLIRILRLVRISGRVQSFAFVVETLQKSISCIGALIIMLVGFVMIFAVLGVGLFRDNSEQFRDFFSAMWTLFITLNGESWPDFAEPLIERYWYTQLYFGTFIITVTLVALNMIISVFIEKMAEVTSKRTNKMLGIEEGGPFKNSTDDRVVSRNGRHHERIAYLSNNGSSEVHNSTTSLSGEERCIFNRAVVQQCIFLLFKWQNQKLISRQECSRGISRILTVRGFRSLAKHILEKQLQYVKLLLRTW